MIRGNIPLGFAHPTGKNKRVCLLILGKSMATPFSQLKIKSMPHSITEEDSIFTPVISFDIENPKSMGKADKKKKRNPPRIQSSNP